MKERFDVKRPVIVMIVVGLLVASYALAEGGINWYTLKEGQEKSKAEVYSNPSIAKKITDDFVPIRIDLTRKLSKEEQSLGEKYEFKNDCLLIFLDRSGNLVKDATGKKLCFIDKVDPDEFIKYLDTVKSGMSK
jgi:hypothetical protein